MFVHLHDSHANSNKDNHGKDSYNLEKHGCLSIRYHKKEDL